MTGCIGDRDAPGWRVTLSSPGKGQFVSWSTPPASAPKTNTFRSSVVGWGEAGFRLRDETDFEHARRESWLFSSGHAFRWRLSGG